MKQVTCKNCGAVFDETLEKCPYCGTMNRRGAYGSFRRRFAGLIDEMLGLREEANRSVSRIIFSSLLRSLILIAAVIGLAFFFSQYAKVNYYNDPERDEEALEMILWEEENLEKLDEAYEKNDFDTIHKLYLENSKAVMNWPHYSDYVLKEKYESIVASKHFSCYQLQEVLYFLYFPQYFTYRRGTEGMDMGQYGQMKESVVKMMEEKGYTEPELADIYARHADSYGYLTASDLEVYVKE